MSQRRFEYKALPPEAIPLLQRYRATLEKLTADIDTIQLEAQAAAEAAQVNAFEEMKALWYQLAPLAGIDAEASWESGEWGLELRYLDDGFGAMTHVARSRGTLDSFRKKLNTAGDEKPNGPPKGATIN